MGLHDNSSPKLDVDHIQYRAFDRISLGGGGGIIQKTLEQGPIPRPVTHPLAVDVAPGRLRHRIQYNEPRIVIVAL